MPKRLLDIKRPVFGKERNCNNQGTLNYMSFDALMWIKGTKKKRQNIYSL